VYVGPGTYRADLERNYYEDNKVVGLDPNVFSNYLFAKGANPNRPFPTKIDSDRVQWVIEGGKILNYQQAGPITVIVPTADDIFQPNDPGMYYVTSGNHIQTMFANFIGGFLSSPSIIVSVDDNVVAQTDTAANQMMANVFEGRDGSVTSGSATLTIGGTNSFTAAMVGFYCYVQNYLSGNIAQQNPIATFTDASHVTLSSAATNTASNLYYRCGRLLNAGQGRAIISDSVNTASEVIEGQTPQYQLRRFLAGNLPENYVWRMDSAGGHVSIQSGASPTGSSYGDWETFVPSADRKTPSSVTFPVPVRIGGATHQVVGIYFQDFTGINFGTIGANSIFTTTLTLGGETVSSGNDGCQVWGSVSAAGIMTQCSILTGNQALVTYANVTSSPITVGSGTIRLEVTKFSYPGP